MEFSAPELFLNRNTGKPLKMWTSKLYIFKLIRPVFAPYYIATLFIVYLHVTWLPNQSPCGYRLFRINLIEWYKNVPQY